MRWKDTCDLIATAYEPDEEGVAQPVKAVRTVFCNCYSVATQAWSTAKLANTTVDTEIQLRSDEYLGEDDVDFRGRHYSVVKPVMNQGEFTRLMLEVRRSDKEADDTEAWPYGS